LIDIGGTHEERVGVAVIGEHATARLSGQVNNGPLTPSGQISDTNGAPANVVVFRTDPGHTPTITMTKDDGEASYILSVPKP